MGHHLTKDNEFKSDKYNWCPKGFFALKFSDYKARLAILYYIDLSDDEELINDLCIACDTAYEKQLKLKGK